VFTFDGVPDGQDKHLQDETARLDLISGDNSLKVAMISK
jgi:hypothetical protein